MGEKKQDIRLVDGYLFDGENDANLARQEKKKIEYLEQHMDYRVPSNVLLVYQKAINERIFKTPIGYEYLKHMQNYLVQTEEIPNEAIIPIKLYVNFEPKIRTNANPSRSRVVPSKEKGKMPVLGISLFLNAALIIAVFAMFVITAKSDYPNILNYETTLVNKYANWEQDLSQREKKIREEERKYKILNNK